MLNPFDNMSIIVYIKTMYEIFKTKNYLKKNWQVRFSMLKVTPYDPAEFLNTKKLQKGYLDYVAKEGTPEELIEAINTVARAKGMSKTAKKAGMARTSLYKALSPEGNPTLDTLKKIANAVGYKLNISFTPIN